MSTRHILGEKWMSVMALSMFLMEDCGEALRYSFPRDNDWVRNTARYQCHLCAFAKWNNDGAIKRNIRRWEMQLSIVAQPNPEIFVVTSCVSGPVPLPNDGFVSSISCETDDESDDGNTTWSVAV